MGWLLLIDIYDGFIYFNYDLKDTVFLEQDWKDYKDFRSKMQNEF